MQTSDLPSVSEFIQGDGHRAEGGGGLALNKSKPLGQFVRYEIAQA